MAREKVNCSRGGWLILILLGVTFLCVNNSQALLLHNTSVGHGNEWESFIIDGKSVSWYTEYRLYATEFDPSPLDAFCVENVSVDSHKAYELVPVPGYLSDAARIANQFFYGTGWSQTAIQIAVWEVVFDTGRDISKGFFKYTSGVFINEVNDIFRGFDSYSVTGPISLAHSPADGNAGSSGSGISQDYLVPAAIPVPEPSTMLLLGAGLIGVFGLSRKKIFKKI